MYIISRDNNFQEYNYQLKSNTDKPVILCTRIDRSNNTVYHVLNYVVRFSVALELVAINKGKATCNFPKVDRTKTRPT
jgi:UDP-galactopyranose mutase